jgi:hypothetical protein
MREPKPPVIVLTIEERHELEALVQRHGTAQQLALRARIILAAAEGQNNTQIARRFGVDVETARLWRGRWLGLGAVPLAELSIAERLEDAPCPGGPCRITAFVCEAPATSGRPISQLKGHEVAAEVDWRGIVDRISPRHAARLLTGWICSPTASATG